MYIGTQICEVEEPRRVEGEVFNHREWVTVTFSAGPFSLDNRIKMVRPGATLLSIVTTVLGRHVYNCTANVFLGDQLIFPELWHRVRPKAGTTVSVRVIPLGGEGGKGILRLILTIAIVVVATLVTAGAAAPLLGPAFAAGTTGAALLAAGITLAGQLLIGALVPPPKPAVADFSQPDISQTAFIRGARNRAAPYGVIPRPLGKTRMVPLFGSSPYTEIVGEDQYLRLLLVWGYGPLEVRDIRIGETPIDFFDDVQIQTISGATGTQSQLTLFPGTVFQDDLAVSLKQTDGFSTRTTATDIDEISLDLVFSQGLIKYNKEGDKLIASVALEIEYAEAGSGVWKKVTQSAVINNGILTPTRPRGYAGAGESSANPANGFNSGANLADGVMYFITSSSGIPQVPLPPFPFDFISQSIQIARRSEAAVRIGVAWKVPRGQYDVRCSRLTADDQAGEDEIVRDAVAWTALRGIRNENPIKKDGLCLTAIRIRASDQLNGVVESINGIVQSVVPDWDAATQTWITRATSNPASLYRSVLQDGANERPLADGRIDLAGLQDFHEKCDTEGREFNMVIDFESTVQQILASVASAGRAARAHVDGKHGVVIDEVKTVPVQHVTPRNSFGYRGEKVFSEAPHGLRVKFANEQQNYQQDEMTVYADGYTSANATKFEALDLPGITNPDQVYKMGRYFLAVGKLRPEKHSFSMDIENMVFTRGDFIKLSNDVPKIGLGAGRVGDLFLDEALANVEGFFIDAEVIMETGKTYAVRVRASDGSSTIHPVSLVVGTSSQLTLLTPVPVGGDIQKGDLFMFGETAKETSDMLVFSLEPLNDLTARVVCLDLAPAVHDADIGPIPDFDTNISQPVFQDVPVPEIVSVQSDEFSLLRDGIGVEVPRIAVKFYFTPAFDTKLKGFRVEHRRKGDPEVISSREIGKSVRSFIITEVEQGEEYTVLIRAETVDERSGPWAQVDHLVIGNVEPPPDVEGMFVEETNNFSRRFRWTYPSKPSDFAGFVVRAVNSAQPLWESGIQLHENLLTSTLFETEAVMYGTWTVMVKAVDVAGNESVSPSFVIVNLGDPLVQNIVEEFDFHSGGFTGTKTNGTVNGTTGDLEANDPGTEMWSGSDLPFWDADTETTMWTTASSNMYQGGTQPMWTNDANLMYGSTYPILMYEDVFSPTAAGLLYVDFLGEGGPAQVFYRRSYPSPMWSQDVTDMWDDDANAMWHKNTAYVPYTTRVFTNAEPHDLKVIMDAGADRSKITRLRAVVDAPDVIERFDDLAIAATTGTRLTLTKPFGTIKNISLSLQDTGGSGVTAAIVDKSATLGPLIRVLDKDGNVVAGTIDAVVQGVQ